MCHPIMQNPSTDVDADGPQDTFDEHNPAPSSPEADSVEDDIISSSSTGELPIFESSAYDSSGADLFPDIRCRDDVRSLESALEDVRAAESLYGSSEAVLSDALSPEKKHQLFTALDKQADLLIYSIDRSKPYTRSYPISFLRPMPFDNDQYWSFDGSDQADLHDAIAMMKSDPKTQKALVDSYSILRNMFIPSRGRGSIESLLDTDVDILERAWADHIREASYLDQRWKRRAREKERWAESFSEAQLRRRVKDAKEAERQRLFARNLEVMRSKAKAALQSLPGEQGEEEVSVGALIEN